MYLAVRAVLWAWAALLVATIGTRVAIAAEAIDFDRRASLPTPVNTLLAVTVVAGLVLGCALIGLALTKAARDAPGLVVVVPLLAAGVMLAHWFGFDPYYLSGGGTLRRRYIDSGLIDGRGRLVLFALPALVPVACWFVARRIAVAAAGLAVIWLTLVTVLAGAGH